MADHHSGKRPVGASSFPSSPATPPAKRAKTSRFGTINPEVAAEIRKYPQRGHSSLADRTRTGVTSTPRSGTKTSTVPSPKPKPKTTQSALSKRLEAHRENAAQSISRRPAIAEPRSSTTKRAFASKKPATNEPAARRLSHITPSPSTKTGAGRPRKASTATVLPTLPATLTTGQSNKRTKSAADDSTKPVTPKPKTSKKAVAFAEKETPLKKKTVPQTDDKAKKTGTKKPATEKSAPKTPAPKKSGTEKPAAQKQAAKKLTKVPAKASEVKPKEKKSTGRSDATSRGTLRSGATFKPKP